MCDGEGGPARLARATPSSSWLGDRGVLGVGSSWPGVRRLGLPVRLPPGLVRALAARSGLSLASFRAASGQERCVGGTTGQRSNERRWIWPEVASSEGKKGKGRRN